MPRTKPLKRKRKVPPKERRTISLDVRCIFLNLLTPLFFLHLPWNSAGVYVLHVDIAWFDGRRRVREDHPRFLFTFVVPMICEWMSRLVPYQRKAYLEFVNRMDLCGYNISGWQVETHRCIIPLGNLYTYRYNTRTPGWIRYPKTKMIKSNRKSNRTKIPLVNKEKQVMIWDAVC